jgi:hypothetical protein
MQSHKDNERVHALRKPAPLDLIVVARGVVAGHDGNAGRAGAVCERYTGIGRDGSQLSPLGKSNTFLTRTAQALSSGWREIGSRPLIVRLLAALKKPCSRLQ